MASRTRVAVSTEPEDNEEYTSVALSKGPKRPVRASRVVQSGWGTPPVQEERKETVKAPYLELKNNGHRIVKALNHKPPVHYYSHFVNSKGFSYTCGKIYEDGELIQKCPLCSAGHKPSARFMLNVVDMADPTTIRKWEFGNEVSGILQGYSRKPSGESFPIDDESRYFEVYHRSVPGRKAPSTQVDRLKASDLYDDYGVMPLTEQEIDELRGDPIYDEDGDVENYENLYGEEVVWVSSISQLTKIAEELTDADKGKK